MLTARDDCRVRDANPEGTLEVFDYSSAKIDSIRCLVGDG